MNWPKLMCLTADRGAYSHVEQVQALCAAGVDWVQLRCKELSDEELESVAFECLVRCREVGATFIVNDRLELALRIGADGVHLGKQDMPWTVARRRAGIGFLIGGTVNSVADAEKAKACGALDYVGVGPFRFTETKKNLAPVLSGEDWVSILQILGEMPSYAIGGIEAADLPKLRTRGAAVCAALYGGCGVSRNYHTLLNAYEI